MAKITEIIVRCDNKPVFSGSKSGAILAANNAMTKALNEGRAEPEIKFVERCVDTDLADNDPAKVIEKTITL